MNKRIIFLITFCFLTGGVPTQGMAQDYLSDRQTLENGMTVVVTRMPATPMVSVYALVKTGSASEGRFLGSGISHFLEHMVFKGTHEHGVGELPSRIQKVGGSINASTGKDYTIYTIDVPHESVDEALDVLSELIMNADIDEEEIEKERQVIHGEMRLYNDNPDRLINRYTFADAYLRHPYRHPIIGYRPLLDKLTRTDIVDYYRERYAPNNVVLSVAGNVELEKLMSRIKEKFKDFKRQTDIPRNLAREPQQISARRSDYYYPTEYARLSMAFSSVPLLHRDLYPLDVLADILGAGQSSRLYERLYNDQRLVFSISAYNYTPVDRGVFGISAMLENKNVDKVIESILDEIAMIAEKGINKKELQKAKRRVLSRHLFDQQTTSSVAYAQAYDEAFTGDHQFTRKYVDGIRQVKAEDIQSVAGTYLMKNRMTVTVLKPEIDDQESKTPDADMSGKIEKFTLENGLRILLRQDKTFPTVCLRLVLNGGLLEEDEDDSGQARLMATMWTKGTKKYSAQKLATLTESLGMGLGAFSGKNSFGISMTFLSEDTQTALGILEDMVKAPSFDEEELVKLKENTIVGIRRRKDNISKFTGLIMRKNLFKSHPYGNAENGEELTVKQMTREDLQGYYRRLVHAKNMVLSVYGDIKPRELLEQLEQRFNVLKASEVTYKKHDVKPIKEAVEINEYLEKEQAMVMIGFQGLGLHDKDRYGLEVLSNIIGSSFSGRLFTKVREELGKAYTLGGVSIPGQETGYVYFYVLTAPDAVDKVKEVLRREIKRIQDEMIDEQELADIKMYLKGRNKADIETNFALAFSTALDELYGLGFNDYKNYDEYIDAVSGEDIMRLARNILDLDKAVTVITIPKKNGVQEQNKMVK